LWGGASSRKQRYERKGKRDKGSLFRSSARRQGEKTLPNGKGQDKGTSNPDTPDAREVERRGSQTREVRLLWVNKTRQRPKSNEKKPQVKGKGKNRKHTENIFQLTKGTTRERSKVTPGGKSFSNGSWGG